MQRRTAFLTTLVLALAACGSTQGASKTQGTGSPSSTSTAAPSSSARLIVVAEEPAAGYTNAPTPVRLMRPDGKEADRLTVKQGARVARAAGGRIFVVGDDGSVQGVHPAG